MCPKWHNVAEGKAHCVLEDVGLGSNSDRHLQAQSYHLLRAANNTWPVP